MKVQIECLCPGRQRHTTDTITLRDVLGFRDAIAIRNEVGMLYVNEPGAGLPDVLAVLTEAYLLRGVESWTLRDAKQQPIPVTRETITKHLLSNYDAAEKAGDAADELYREAVMLPLLRKASASSQPTPTDESTSAPTPSSTVLPMPSKRSSTFTTQMDDTGPISESPGGGSKSSQKSA